jgi:uncharacterized protein
MKLMKFFAHAALGAIATVGMNAGSARARELKPKVVIEAVYQGIRQVEGNRAAPRLYWNVRNGTNTACGRISGSVYCPRSNSIYITRQHIKMAYKYGDAALAYIVAHEYAHAIQFVNGFMPRNITLAELQADCLAGYYLGTIQNVTLDERDIQEIATQAYKIGDFEFGNPNHHGTPKQRTNAVLSGFKGSQTRGGINVCQVRE